MRCNFDVRPEVPPNRDGWHYVACVRCGKGTYTPYGVDRVRSECSWLAPYGVGDLVAIVTRATGIEAWWKKITAPKGGCGCEERQSFLNRWMPLPTVVRGFLAIVVLWWRERATLRRQSPPEATDHPARHSR